LQGENTMKNRFHFYSKFYRGFWFVLFFFSNQTNSILEADMGFIDAIGLEHFINANGLVSMIKNIVL
jgi:hypothetical protein